MTAAAPLLVVRGLTRRYGELEALHAVDLGLCSGESVALLGPNGAGKTTLLSILAGVERASAGEVRWEQLARERVGWVPQRPSVYGHLSARENLLLFARLERRERSRETAARLLDAADLGTVADRRARELSTGTLQRLNLSVALAGDPSVLLLDEPTGTLSLDQRERLWTWLTDLQARDRRALLFSTQSVEEAVQRADRLVVLVGGRIVFSGTAADLTGLERGAPEATRAAEQAFLRLVDE